MASLQIRLWLIIQICCCSKVLQQVCCKNIVDTSILFDGDESNHTAPVNRDYHANKDLDNHKNILFLHIKLTVWYSIKMHEPRFMVQ